MAETAKAHERRWREDWPERYLRGQGVDIGCGDDPLTPDCERWEVQRGPLTGSWDWIYSSHCLEHIALPEHELARWWGCLRPGGFLLLALPHRDRYERRLALPSRWNGDHKHFWLPERFELPDTRSLFHAVKTACPGAELLRLTVEDTGWDPTVPLDQHPCGEYSIEGVWRKPT